MDDLLGTALGDYYHKKATGILKTETSISELDDFPLSYLFRTWEQMPELEKQALSLCKGRVLDAGCGAGSHSLHLQNKGHQVTAIDQSAGAIAVATKRGVFTARVQDLKEVKNEKFDTILLLMNGTGIFQKLENLHSWLLHLKSLLTDKGQILVDSSDLQYMYDTTESGALLLPNTNYYGEIHFKMHYKGQETDWFPWLYLDEGIFEEAATYAGYKFEVVLRGNNFDYLARLTV